MTSSWDLPHLGWQFMHAILEMLVNYSNEPHPNSYGRYYLDLEPISLTSFTRNSTSMENHTVVNRLLAQSQQCFAHAMAAHLPWASYQIRKIAGCACARNAGNVFPRRRFQRKPLVSDPDMHHGTCVTHVPWCMSGSLTCGNGENVPGIPGACAPGILRIWQEAHIMCKNL